jgi:phosphatidate cytidylyltransferase
VSNLLQRLLLFFLGVPLVVAIILLLPQYNHGAAVLIILAFTGGCSLELSRLFRSRGIKADAPSFLALGIGLPAAAYAGGLIAAPDTLTGACLGLIAAGSLILVACLLRFALVSKEGIPDVLSSSSAIAFASVYPGLLGAIIVLIASEPRYATASLLSFAIMAFGNDSIAWLVGVTLGRHRGIVAVSPNKSAEGFAGGMCATIGLAFACRALFPEAFSAAWWQVLVLGLVDGLAVILGDLFESSLKRSAAIKDSGSSVPGRGGFLDSFDSLLFSAPVFYGLSLLMGLFR